MKIFRQLLNIFIAVFIFNAVVIKKRYENDRKTFQSLSFKLSSFKSIFKNFLSDFHWKTKLCSTSASFDLRIF